MKNNWRLFACLCALPAFPLLAQSEDQENLFVNQTSSPEAQEVAMFLKNPEACVKKSKDPSKNMQKPEEEMIHSQPTITPSAAPYISEGSDVFATVDFIWWKTAISGSEYAYTGVTDNGNFVAPLGTSTGSGRVKKPELDFQPGFKIGLGVNFEHDGWDLYANYTYLSGPDEKNSVVASTGTGATTLLYTTTNDGTSRTFNVVSDSCKWYQDFNVVDLELGRNFFISRFLTMRPHAGFKTGWIFDKGQFNFVPVPGVLDGSNTLLAASNLRSQHLWGLGIRTGMNTGWHVTKNWSFYADFAVTTLWSDFHIKVADYVTETTSGNTQTRDTRETFQTVMPILEAGLGLAYITWWDQSRYRFQIQAGWEEQVWLDYNHFMRLGQSGGSLTVQGLTSRIMLTF